MALPPIIQTGSKVLQEDSTKKLSQNSQKWLCHRLFKQVLKYSRRTAQKNFLKILKNGFATDYSNRL
jgi:hypothetical protein